jgi:hypothetical protein
MNSILFIFSCLGLIMSILTHFALQFGVNIQDYPVSPSLLHIGIFLTFAPSLILFMSKNKNETDEKGKKLGLRILYRDSPKVLIGLAFVIYLYAILNFFIFMGSMSGSPARQGEKYILSNHGKLIREITFEEFKLYQRKEAIGFSGHWMLFYAAAMLLSNPFRASRLKKS